MGLECFVMPLWRFKAGDFADPVEQAFGLRPKVVTPEGIFAAPTPSTVGWWTRWRCRRQVARIRRAVAKANRTPISWHDEGDVVLSETRNGMEPLRAFALWLDHRDLLPTFEPPPDGNFYDHPVWAIESDRPITSPHLVGHSCFNGYYLPCEFAEVIQVEPYKIMGHWPATRAVGSSVRLQQELIRLKPHLPGPEPTPGQTSDDNPLAPIWWAFGQLQEAAELSVRHGLPVIFWG